MLMVAPVNSSAWPFEVRAAERLFAIRPRPSRLDAYPYDVSSDGKRILVNTFLEELMPPISLILNWSRSQ
jgi:hypothetical protein